MKVGAVHPGTHFFPASFQGRLRLSLRNKTLVHEANLPSASRVRVSDSFDVQQKPLYAGTSLCTDSNGVRVLLGLNS